MGVDETRAYNTLKALYFAGRRVRRGIGNRHYFTVIIYGNNTIFDRSGMNWKNVIGYKNLHST